MFSLYDFAEIGACFASFFTLLFVLVRKPGHVSARLYVAAALCTFLMWVAFILIIPRPAPVRLWQHGILVALLAVASALWLLFLMVFAREDTTGVLRTRSLTIYGMMALLAAAAVVSFFVPFFQLDESTTGRLFRISSVGKYFIVLLIIASTFSLLQLESTFRASVGQLRRSLMLPLLMLGTLLAILLVLAMIALLYSRVDFVGVQLAALAMIGAMVLTSRFLAFKDIQGQRVVISREAVYSSVAVLLVGAYFLLIGITVWVLVSLGGSPKTFFSVLAAFAVIVIFVALFLSSSVRARWRGLVDRSIYSGKLDLLTDLATFAEDVTAATDMRDMFATMIEVLQHKCQMADVVIALSGNRRSEFEFGYPIGEPRTLRLPEIEDWLFRAGKMTTKTEVMENLPTLTSEERQLLAEPSVHYLIPLMARKELVGFICCRSLAPPSAEVRFLIDSISHQLALSLLSARQSQTLLETRELASFTKISSFVIHDVKNLISMLSMILQNAEKKFGDPRFQQITVDTLRGAQERMRRMINRLSSPSKQIDYVLSDCDLERVVLDLAEEMKLSAQRKIAAKIDLGELPLVRGNPEKLKSVVSNLVINAIEAMPDGGELSLGAATDDQSVTLTVKDTGVGMTPEFIREKLFRPFQTSKKSGLGIGLFQSKELVEQMGGELTVTSAAGEGSCFKLRLRRA